MAAETKNHIELLTTIEFYKKGQLQPTWPFFIWPYTGRRPCLRGHVITSGSRRQQSNAQRRLTGGALRRAPENSLWLHTQ